MPELTGQPIVTNYGKAQILASTADITKIKLGSGVWTPAESDTALDTEESSVAATGAVVPIPAGGSRLHINGQDAGAGVYDLHEFALTDDTDQALVIYSQAAVIDTKGGGSTLVFAADLVIEQAGAGTISISGVTDFDLPQASDSLKGIIEIATDAEADAGVDTTRAITAKQGKDIQDRAVAEALSNPIVLRAYVRLITGTDPADPTIVHYWGGLPDPQYVGDTVRVQIAPAPATEFAHMLAHVAVVDAGSFVNIGQIEVQPVSSDFVDITIHNNANQRIDLGANTLELALWVYGDA